MEKKPESYEFRIRVEPDAFVRFNRATDRRLRRIAITKIIIIASTIVVISAIAGYYNILGNWTR